MYISAVLIAGGKSRRSPPLMVREEEAARSSVVAAAETLLRTCADEVVVVLGKRAAEAVSELPPTPRLRVVADPDPAEKERALLRVGIEAASNEATAYLIHRTDSTTPPAATIDRMISHFLRGGRPIAVVVNGVGLDHPIFVSRTLRDELVEPGEEGWLRGLIARDPTRFLVLRVDARGAVRLIEGPASRSSLPTRRAPEKAD